MEPIFTCYQLPREGEELKRHGRRLLEILNEKGLYYRARAGGFYIAAKSSEEAPILAQMLTYWEIWIYERKDVLKDINSQDRVLTDEDKSARETIRGVLRDYQPE